MSAGSEEDSSFSLLVTGGYMKMDDVSGGYGYTNIKNIPQHNSSSSLINYNDSDDSDVNGYLKNGNVSCWNGFINIHTIYQFNE